jgi:hypothetical protein
MGPMTLLVEGRKRTPLAQRKLIPPRTLWFMPRDDRNEIDDKQATINQQ